MLILFSTRENIIYRRAGAKLFHIRGRAKLIPVRTHAVMGTIYARTLKKHIACAYIIKDDSHARV